MDVEFGAGRVLQLLLGHGSANDFGAGSGRVGGLVSQGIVGFFQLFLRARFLEHFFLDIFALLTRRERQCSDKITDLIRAGFPLLAIGRHDTKIDGVGFEYRKGVRLPETLAHILQQALSASQLPGGIGEDLLHAEQ